MKLVIALLAAVACLTGATLAAGASQPAAIEDLRTLEAEIEAQLDSNVREMLTEIRVEG